MKSPQGDMMDNNTLIILAVAVGIIVLPRLFRSIGQISPVKAKELAANGALIVDVRESSEFRTGHINKAVNIPLNNINKISSKADKDRDIIVYCQSGARSSSALKRLKAMGYSKVYDLGSINRWRK